jgi:hypothetical protein
VAAQGHSAVTATAQSQRRPSTSVDAESGGKAVEVEGGVGLAQVRAEDRQGDEEISSLKPLLSKLDHRGEAARPELDARDLSSATASVSLRERCQIWQQCAQLARNESSQPSRSEAWELVKPAWLSGLRQLPPKLSKPRIRFTRGRSRFDPSRAHSGPRSRADLA